MLDTLFDIGTSILSGGATGLIGTAISRVMDYFGSKQEHRQEMDLRRLDVELARVEAAGAGQVAAIEAESERDQAEWRALGASYQEAARRWSRPGEGFLMTFVDVVRGMTRPVLTFGLVGLAGTIYFTVGAVDLAEEALRPRIVDTVLYLATASVLWWFGTRPRSKAREGAK